MNKLTSSDKKYFGFGQVPIGIGALLKGWDISEADFRNPKVLPVVDFRAMTSACPHDCLHCFTDKSQRTLSLGQIKKTIEEIGKMGARGIDFVGEGEPTIDQNFFEIIEFTASQGIIPVVFTDGATRLRDESFVNRLEASGCSVCLKGDSLFNAEYQNWVVGDKSGAYFKQRNEATNLLLKSGFNRVSIDGTTRIGFDMVISSRNIHEVSETLRFCRKNNIWIIFSTYLPAGRSNEGNLDDSLRPSRKSINKMRRLIRDIDEQEFGFKHYLWNNFVTMPCVEQMQIYGDGRVSPCPGNETIIGNITDGSVKSLFGKNSIETLHRQILKRFPGHNPECFNGNCPYRPRF